MPTFDSIRQQAPWMQDWSDEEVMLKLSELTGTSVRDVAKDFGVKVDEKRNPLAAGVSAGVDELQGLGYSGAAAVADVLGAKGAKNWLERQALANQVQSELAGRPDLERIEEQTLGSALPYAGYQIAKQIPNVVGAIAAGALVPEVAVPAALSRGAAMLPRALGGGGLDVAGGYAAKRAALETGKTFGKQVVGGLAFNEAQSVGSLYQAAREGGDENAGAKALLGSPLYALSETLPEAMLVGRFKGGSGFTGNILTRMGKSAGVQGISGATSEGLQNEMEMALNPTLTEDQKFSNRLNSIAAGGLVEGILGGLGGMSKGGRLPSRGSLVPGANASDQTDTTQTSDDRATNTAIDSSSTAPSVLQAANIDEAKLATFVAPTGQAQADQQLAEAKVQADEQAQQQAQMQVQMQQQQRTAALQSFGVIRTPEQTKSGMFLGQAVYGADRLNAIADALNNILPQLPESKVLVARALMDANANTGGKRIGFKFDGSNIQKSVQKGFEALDKLEQKLQIDQADSLEEVADILNNLSQTAGRNELEFINAVYESITGQHTIGYEQSQGATNGKLQVQQQGNAGVRTIPKQGGASQAAGEELGLLRPELLQPVQSGGQPVGSPTVQVDAGREDGVRAGTSNGTATSVSGNVSAPSPQVIGVHRGQQTGTQGTVATAPQASGSTAEAGQVRTAEEVGGENAVGTAESFLNELVDTVVQRAGKMKAADVQKYRDFIAMYMQSDPNTIDYSEAAHYFGITPAQAKRWARDARNFSVKWAKPISEVLPGLMEKYNLDKEQLLAVIGQAETQTKTMIEEVGGAVSAVDERDLSMIGEGAEETGADIKTKGRKSESIQERFNTAETLAARYTKLADKYDTLQDEGKTAEAEAVQAEMDAVTQKLAELETKRVAKKAAEKGEKNAVQEPSAEEVPVRKRAGGGEGVRKENTGKRKAAKEVIKAEAKPEEKVDPEHLVQTVDSLPKRGVFYIAPGTNKQLQLYYYHHIDGSEHIRALTNDVEKSNLIAAELASQLHGQNKELYKSSEVFKLDKPLEERAKPKAKIAASNVANMSDLELLKAWEKAGHSINHPSNLEAKQRGLQLFQPQVRQQIRWNAIAEQYGLPKFADLPAAAQADVVTAKGELTLAKANEIFEANKKQLSRVAEPNRNGFPTEKQYKGAVDVVAFMNGDINKEQLIQELSSLNLLEAQVEALTMRLRDDWLASDTRAVMGKGTFEKGQASKTTHSIVDADQTYLEDVASRFPAVQNVVDTFNSMGIGNSLTAAQIWATTTDNTFLSDGVYEVLPEGWQGVMFHEDNIDPDIDPDAELNVAHELGHAIDMAGHGGIYSNQIEMMVSAKDGKIRPMGVVMQEMYDLYQNNGGWKQYLEYPFDHTAYPKLANNAERIRTELFAQLFSAYTNPTLREAMRLTAPVTYKYMTEVFKNVESTKSFYGKTEAAATNRRQAFANRNAQGGAQARQTGGDGGGNEVGQSYDKISSKTKQWVGQSKGFIDNLPTWARGPVRTVHNVLFGGKETALGLMITEDIAELAKKFMRSVTKYVEVQHLRNSLIATKERRLTSIKTLFEELDTNTRRTVNDLIASMTVNGKWAFDPQLEGVKKELVDPTLQARFNSLPTNAQKVIKEVFAVGRESLQEKKDTIRKIIDDEFNERMTAAETDVEKADVLRRKKAMEKQFAGILTINPNTPYSPLKRFGTFVVVAKSPAYAEAEAANDTKTMRTLESDESDYIVEFAETAGEAEQLYDELNALGKYHVAAPFKKSAARDSLYRGTDLYKGFAKLKRVLAAEKGVEASLKTKDAELLGRMETMVNDLYLLSLADSSARKSEMQRKKISGFNRDMMRAFFTQGMADAHYIANLKTADQTMDTMVQMQKEAGENRAQAYPYLNEIMAREAQSLEVREPSLGDAMNRMAGDWFLTFSPSFYFQQMTQTYVLSLPWLAGKYNYFKSERALRQAYKQILPLVKGTGLKEHMDFSKAPEDVREMLKDLVGRGRIDIGVEAELGGFRSEASNPLSEAYGNAANRLRGAINRIEALNRSVAAIAAYRLEMQKSGDKVKATEAADKVVHVTHGSYDGFNTPRLFNKNAVTRSLTQFRRFQIIQLSMLARMVHNAFSGASKTERAMGRKQLAFLLGHTFALGGIKGMPIYVPAALAYSMLTAAFGDEDDPEDFEAWLRSKGGVLLARGIPANMGIDLSGKLGMGNVLSVLPYTDVDLSSKQGYANLLLGASGPFLGGLVPKMIDGVNLVAGGDYYRGLEQMLPNGLNNGIKMLRFNTEGIAMRNGDVVLPPEEIGFVDTVFQGLGLPTTTVTERQYTQGQVIKFDQFYSDRAKEVKNDYTRAYKSNDSAAMSEARGAWNNLQESRVKYGYNRKPLSDLIKAPREQAKRERSVIGGVETTKSNKGFVRNITEE